MNIKKSLKLLGLFILILFSFDFILATSGPNSFLMNKHIVFFFISSISFLYLIFKVLIIIIKLIRQHQWKILVLCMLNIVVVSIIIVILTDRLRQISHQKAINVVDSIIYEKNLNYDIHISPEMKNDFKEIVQLNDNIIINNFVMNDLYHSYLFTVQSDKIKTFIINVTFKNSKKISILVYRPTNMSEVRVGGGHPIIPRSPSSKN